MGHGPKIVALFAWFRSGLKWYGKIGRKGAIPPLYDLVSIQFRLGGI